MKRANCALCCLSMAKELKTNCVLLKEQQPEVDLFSGFIPGCFCRIFRSSSKYKGPQNEVSQHLCSLPVKGKQEWIKVLEIIKETAAPIGTGLLGKEQSLQTGGHHQEDKHTSTGHRHSGLRGPPPTGPSRNSRRPVHIPKAILQHTAHSQSSKTSGERESSTAVQMDFRSVHCLFYLNRNSRNCPTHHKGRFQHV